MKRLLIATTILVIASQAYTQFQPVDDSHLYWENLIYFQVVPQEDHKLSPYSSESRQIYKSGIPELDDLIIGNHVDKISPLSSGLKSPTLQNTYRLELKKGEGNLSQTINLLTASQSIVYAERMPKNYSMIVPNDADVDQLWFMNPIEACEGWDIMDPKEDVIVAVVDDAILWNHEDLQDNLWVNTAESNGTAGVDDDNNGTIDDVIGYDMASLDNNPSPPGNATADYFSHGTHVAGTVGAVTNNGRGIASIAFNTAKIMSCKGSRDSDAAYTNIWEAFAYAVVNGADVINNSWGRGVDSNGNPPAPLSQTEIGLLEEAANRDIIVLFAAGNDNNQMALPASSELVISVAATGNPVTGEVDEKAYYSNYGSWVDISAPGSQILSTVPGDEKYSNQQGTSMACPNVASLVALMKSHAPNLSNDQIINCLFSSADDISGDNPDYIGQLGHGRINVRKAIECVSGDVEVCNAPSSLSVSDIEETSAELNWNAATNAMSYFVEIRSKGDANWFSFANNPFATLSLTVTGLVECRDYEFRVKSMCTDGESLYSQIESFETECNSIGCGIPSGLFVNNISEDQATLRWSSVGDSDSYTIQARQVGTTDWVEASEITDTQIDYTGLSACTDYEFRVAAVCSGQVSEFSTTTEFSSAGCASDCNPITSITITQIGEDEAKIDWPSVSGSTNYELRYKHEATNTWQTETTILSQSTVTDLISCREYEVQVLNICNSNTSDYSTSEFFDTECPNCSSPTTSSIQVLAITDDKATIEWDGVSTALSYEIQARAVGSSDWVTGDLQTSGVLYSGLVSCTDYEFQVKSLCEADESDFGQLINFSTLGCSGDPDCISYSDNSLDEWIDRVEIGSLLNNSGIDYGYALFDNWAATTFTSGSNYQVKLTPGYSSSEFEEYWKVWIDLNRDNDFNDSGELVYESGAGVIGEVSGSFTLPSNISDGETFLRVSMKYVNENSQPQTACENFSFGEVEDYQINLSSVVSVDAINPNEVIVSPNPTDGRFTVSHLGLNNHCALYSPQGSLIDKWVSTSDTRLIDIRDVPNGIYLLKVTAQTGRQSTFQLVKQ